MQKIELLLQTQKELQVAKRQKSVHNHLIDEFKNKSKSVSNNKKFIQHQSKFLSMLDELTAQNKVKKTKMDQFSQRIKNKEQEQKKGEELVQNIEHRNYFFLEHFYQQLYDISPELDYQDHNNNFVLYEEIGERIDHIYQLKVQEQEQRNNEIGVLNNEIKELLKYQQDIEQTIQISKKQIQRIDDNIQQNIKTEIRSNYQQEFNKLTSKQNQYKEKRQQINSEQQEYIKEGVSKITELKVKRQTKENVVVAQLKQIDHLKKEIKIKKNTRFDVRNFIRKMEWFVEMDGLLKSNNIPKQIELMSKKEFMDQYLAKIELKKIEKNQLLNRLDSFYKEIGELNRLEEQILTFLRSLHIEYLTLQNRHNDLIIQKKELKKNLMKQSMVMIDFGKEEVDSEDEENMLKSIPQDQENMTINDLVFKIQSIKTNYYKQVNQESEIYLVKLFFFLYNCVNKFNKLFTFINLRLNSTNGLRQFLNIEFIQLRRKIKELNNLKKYGLFKKIGQYQQEQQQQQQQSSLFHSQAVELVSKQNKKTVADSQHVKSPGKQNRQSQFEDEIQPFLIQSYKENVKIFLREFPNKNKEARIYAQQFQDNLYLQYFIDQHERKVFMFQIINNFKKGDQSLRQLLGNQFGYLKQKALVNIRKEMEFIFEFHESIIQQSQELKDLKIRDIQEIDQSFNYNIYKLKRDKVRKLKKEKNRMINQEVSIDTVNVSQVNENKENKADVSESLIKIERSYQGDKRQSLIESLNHQNQNDTMQYQNGVVAVRPTYMKEMTRKDIEMFNTKKRVQLDYQQQVLKLVSRDRQYRNKSHNSTSQGFAYSRNYQQISKLKKYQQLTPIHVDFENERDENYSSNMKRFKLSVVNQNNVSVQESRKHDVSAYDNRRDSDNGMRNSYMSGYQYYNSNSRNISRQNTNSKNINNEQDEPNKQHRKLNRVTKQSVHDSKQQSYLRFKPSTRAHQSLGKQILAKLEE